MELVRSLSSVGGRRISSLAVPGLGDIWFEESLFCDKVDSY